MDNILQKRLEELTEQYAGCTIAYDGCHKIYICENEKDKIDAKDCGYDNLFDIESLAYLFNKSCPLRFVRTWNLEILIGQFDFDYEDDEDEEI